MKSNVNQNSGTLITPRKPDKIPKPLSGKLALLVESPIMSLEWFHQQNEAIVPNEVQRKLKFGNLNNSQKARKNPKTSKR